MKNARERRSGRDQRLDLRFDFSPQEAQPRLLAWYRGRSRSLPWRERFAATGDPYVVWVSEIMLQQTVIKAVIPVFERFLAAFPTVHDLAAAGEDAVRSAVRGLGYYRRFRFMHAAAKELVAGARLVWPRTEAGWRELPGVGAYTAAAVASIAFGAPAAVVDGNVERVLCRLLDLREAPNAPALKPAFLRLAAELLHPRHPGDWNQALMELGQTLCTPERPGCAACPLADGCQARRRGSQALAPAAKLRGPPPQDVAMRLVITERGGKIALLPRPPSARFLKGTWGFLTELAAPAAAAPAAGPRRWQADGEDGGSPCDEARAIGRVRHTITHHRIVAEVAVARPRALAARDVRWLENTKVEAELVSNLDRKAWHLYQRALTASGSRRRP